MKNSKTAKKTSEKPQILLIHGFRGNHIGLEEVKKLLEEADFEVFTPDVPPAIDESESIEKGREYAKNHPLDKSLYTKDGYADWVADYIKSHGLKKPFIVGHSMGSIITAATAEKYPDLIQDRVTFLAPIATTPHKFITYLVPFNAITPNKPTGFATTTYLIVRKDMKRKILKLVYRCSKYVYSKKDLARAAKFSCLYSIRDFKMPEKLCFIAGETDRIVSPKDSEKLAKKLNAKFVLLKNTGHLLNYECPDAVATEIIKFIKGNHE